jgi:hypothetical protein
LLQGEVTNFMTGGPPWQIHLSVNGNLGQDLIEMHGDAFYRIQSFKTALH